VKQRLYPVKMLHLFNRLSDKGFVFLTYTKPINHAMLNRIMFLTLTLSLCLASCKQEGSTSSSNDISSIAGMEQVYSKYKETPSVTTAKEVITGINKEIANPDRSKSEKLSLIEQGYKISKDNKLSGSVISFLYPLIKDAPNSADSKDRLYELTSIMFQSNKTAAASVLAAGFKSKYPNDDRNQNLQSKGAISADTIDQYLATLGSQIFVNPDLNGLNRKASIDYIDACQAYALVNVNNDKAPENLYKAAEVAKSIRSVGKALSLYDWILEKYPNFEKAPTTLFIKGFLIENELGNDALAKEVYEEFLQKYPDNDLVDDVNFLLENIGKSDEEISKMIEAKQQSK